MTRRFPARLDRSWLRLQWEIRRVWQRVGWVDFAAAAAVGFCAGLILLVNNPLERQVRRLSAQSALSSAGAGAANHSSSPAQGGAEGRPQAFMAFLPPVQEREEQLQRIHALAQESRVELSRIEYGHSTLKHLPGDRLTLQLTIVADYDAYRKFLHGLLMTLPNLAIDRVSTESAAGQAARVNVRLESSLYYRHADAGSGR